MLDLVKSFFGTVGDVVLIACVGALLVFGMDPAFARDTGEPLVSNSRLVLTRDACPMRFPKEAQEAVAGLRAGYQILNGRRVAEFCWQADEGGVLIVLPDGSFDFLPRAIFVVERRA